MHCISRHQLSRSEQIRCTSQNSSVCLEISLEATGAQELWQACRRALACLAAPGAQPGLCLAPMEAVTESVQRFGQRCQQVPVGPADARRCVSSGIWLTPVDQVEWAQGQIGALAAVGLRASGHDGRVIWLPGLRRLQGVITKEQLVTQHGIAGAVTLGGQPAGPQEKIKLGAWIRPVLRHGKPYLLIKKPRRGEDYEWELLGRAAVKAIDQ